MHFDVAGGTNRLTYALFDGNVAKGILQILESEPDGFLPLPLLYFFAS